MTEKLFSASWYRVAGLKPRLRLHAQIHRHHYRGQLWYVLQDHASQRYHRFSPAAYFVLGFMDGTRTVQEAWEVAAARLGDNAPTQDEMIQLLAQLHGADVLQCDVPPDVTELLRRFDRRRRSQWKSRLLSPLFWQFPLFDPERLLDRFMPLARPFFGIGGALLAIAIVAPAAVLAVMHAADLTQDVVDRVMAPQNLVVLWLLFPILKTLHEFGHAFATKAYGGEVHEMGVMLLVLMPLPYMDASAASALRAKGQRILVGAAGMIVELIVASLALFVWLNVEPGSVRVVAYNILFIAGVSTVLFNANPLLRYDGYFILGDYLEIPNLRSRSNAYLTYLCERYLFGRRDAESGATAPGERAWFVFYAIASFLYRIVVLAAIVLFIAGQFFFVGVVLALGGVVAWGIVPLAKGLAYLCTSPRLRRLRLRAIAASSILAAIVLATVFWAPLPLRTRAEGVIWIPDRGIVRAHTDGLIDRIVAQPGSRVQEGDLLIICKDPTRVTRVKVLELRLEEMRTRYTAQWIENPAKAALLQEEIVHLRASLSRAREQVAELSLRSRATGTFVVPQAQDLPGQFVRQGKHLAYVLDLSTLTARVVVSQAEVHLVRHQTRAVEVRLAEHLSKPVPARIVREVPAASEELPSVALGTPGGGHIAVDPLETQQSRAMQKLFQFDLELPSNLGMVNMGGRVYVRFDHGNSSLVERWYRQIRQLFLSRFHV